MSGVGVISNSPAQAGEIIKFTLESDGAVVVTNRNLGASDYDLRIMTLRRSLVDPSDINQSSDDDFVDMTPSLSLNNELNNHFLTKGHYALRFTSDSNVTIFLTTTGVQEVSDNRVSDKLGLVLTQYRESPNLLGMMRAYLNQLLEVKDVLNGIPEKFDIDVAVGDQLTIVGRWLGFPRCHNVPSAIPIFGFECGGRTSTYRLSGFCEQALWLDCPDVSSFEVCITDDELYRRLLYVRRYQLLGLCDYRSFVFCIIILFGSEASYTQTGRVIDVSPGRALTDNEQSFLRVYERVLPRAVGAIVNVNI